MKTCVVLIALLLVCCADEQGGRTRHVSQNDEPVAETAVEPRASDLSAISNRILPLHKKMGFVEPGDWLESHREPGQTFNQYLNSNPVLTSPSRRTIVILPIGTFKGGQKKILTDTAEFMRIYFGLPVRIERGLSVDESWPEDARRIHPSWGDDQLHTGYILNDLLKPRLPKDAATYLALTAMDLWPGKNWNFVFGQASIRNRVGVWSIYRSGNVNGTPEEFKTALLHTIKTATHETAHMFSMLHCTAFQCNLNGSNSLSESARHPLHLCPECLPKLLTATGTDPIARFSSLADFCRKNGLTVDAEFYEKSLAALD